MGQNEMMGRIGKPIGNLNKEQGYKLLKEIGVKDNAKRFDCVSRVAKHLEDDEPFLAMYAAEEYIDITGAYRLFAALLTPVTNKRSM